MAHMTVSMLADRVGVGPDTIRYYERVGLLPTPVRTPAGSRQYDESVVDRPRFIRGELVGLAADDAVDGGVLGADHLGIAAIFRGSGWSWPRPERRDPEQILAERFAAGEIDGDEYQRRLQVLRTSRHDAWQRQP
jgi:hypothetical protein